LHQGTQRSPIRQGSGRNGHRRAQPCYRDWDDHGSASGNSVACPCRQHVQRPGQERCGAGGGREEIMAMSSGNATAGLQNEINVTPMIDVLLVLLIIFMMVIPMSRKAIDLQLPDPTPDNTNSGPPPSQIVLEVLPNNVFRVNTQPVAKNDLAKRLKEIYDPRPEKIIFVKGDPAVKYSDVIWAMDVSRGAGVKVIGVPPKDVK